MIKKTIEILKDPMCKGALIGLGVSVAFMATALIYGLVLDAPRHIMEKFEFVVNATYPHRFFEPVSRLCRRLNVDDDIIEFGAFFLWYTQCGFFAGLFYKLVRKRRSVNAAALLTLLLVLIIIGAASLINHDRF